MPGIFRSTTLKIARLVNKSATYSTPLSFPLLPGRCQTAIAVEKVRDLFNTADLWFLLVTLTATVAGIRPHGLPHEYHTMSPRHCQYVFTTFSTSCLGLSAGRRAAVSLPSPPPGFARKPHNRPACGRSPPARSRDSRHAIARRRHSRGGLGMTASSLSPPPQSMSPDPIDFS